MPTPLHTHTAKQNYLVCLIHSTQCLICLFFVQKEIAAYWEILLRNGHVLFFRKNFINPQKAITILKLLSHRLLYNLENRPTNLTSKIERTEITLSLTLPRLTDWQTDRQTDKQTDRQTNRQRVAHSLSLSRQLPSCIIHASLFGT
jgi:hypothetical protein